MNFKIIIWFVLLIWAASCRQPGDIVLPETSPVLVVNSVFCKDSNMSVRLSYTQGITDNSPRKYEAGAIVTLHDKDSVLMATFTNNGNGWYSLAQKPQVSKLYFLKIQEGSNIYWTNDSVPPTPQIIINDTSRIFFQGRPNFFLIEMALADKQTAPGYYGIKLRYNYEVYTLDDAGQHKDTAYKEEWLDIETNDPLLNESEFAKFSKKHLLFTDRYFNNTTAILKPGSSAIIRNNRQKPHFLIIYTEQYSPMAFQYYATINEHIFYQNDPFSQPAAVSGNIGKAYGAFTGRSVKADTIHFKQ